MQLSKKVFYFTPYDILRSRTNQISDVRFCEGFAQNGYDVTLIAPFVYRKDNISRKKVLDTYGIESQFKVVYLPTLFFKDISGKFNMSIILFLNSIYYLFISLSFTANNKPLIVSRSASILYPLIQLKRLFRMKSYIITWVHEIKQSARYEHVYKHSDFVFGTNSVIVSDMNQLFGIENKKMGVTLNPITEYQVNNFITKEQARQKVKVNSSPLVVYTGKLFIDQEEVKYILNAAKQLPQYYFLLTGGKSNVVKYYKQWCSDNGIDNVRFTGYIYDYRDLRFYQMAADVLLSYYTEKEHSLRYNLPQKIIEYMLTKNPIVTPDFESTKDILNEDNAIFVKANNLEELKKGIVRAIEDPKNSSRLANNAYVQAKEYTFKKIIKRLLQKIKDNIEAC